MKYLLIIITSFLVSFDCYAQFRATEWGDSVEEVKSSETAEFVHELVEGKKIDVIYIDKVANMDVHLTYSFINDKLIRANYNFIDSQSENTTYVDDFHKVENILTDKYGVPMLNEFNWLDETYKNNKGMLDRAIFLGHVQIYSIWVTDLTQFSHGLMKINNKVFHTVDYASKELMYLEDEFKQARNDFDF